MADLTSTYATIGQNLLSGPADQAAALDRLQGRSGIVGQAFGAVTTAARLAAGPNLTSLTGYLSREIRDVRHPAPRQPRRYDRSGAESTAPGS